MDKIRWGGFGAAVVALVLLVGVLSVGCAQPAESTGTARQPVINGTVDDDTVTANAVVGLESGGWCTVTLITSTYVLTAAHCVANGWSGVANVVLGLVPERRELEVAADGC